MIYLSLVQYFILIAELSNESVAERVKEVDGDFFWVLTLHSRYQIVENTVQERARVLGEYSVIVECYRFVPV
jgi:hypothetical protein